ncbi:MAG: hypothetical protein Edafosvirus17_27 [Edafosvirus sp.]|uniref:F-box domain-containing protein n=1 Tax=Edafosvirus sp. TaxID=2487765 RepID=A0A3G4ZX25_9VIRU|nr:MAG: hypothetical protein Edafosvirus17_27 [Edafosvirus sp.]
MSGNKPKGFVRKPRYTKENEIIVRNWTEKRVWVDGSYQGKRATTGFGIMEQLNEMIQFLDYRELLCLMSVSNTMKNKLLDPKLDGFWYAWRYKFNTDMDITKLEFNRTDILNSKLFMLKHYPPSKTQEQKQEIPVAPIAVPHMVPDVDLIAVPYMAPVVPFVDLVADVLHIAPIVVPHIAPVDVPHMAPVAIPRVPLDYSVLLSLHLYDSKRADRGVSHVINERRQPFCEPPKTVRKITPDPRPPAQPRLSYAEHRELLVKEKQKIKDKQKASSMKLTHERGKRQAF